MHKYRRVWCFQTSFLVQVELGDKFSAFITEGNAIDNVGVRFQDDQGWLRMQGHIAGD